MLNADLGKTGLIDGSLSILTRRGVAGHAVYGPYIRLEPGDYAVEFEMMAIGSDAGNSDAAVCAIIDVACDVGDTILARRELSLGDLLLSKDNTFCLTFSVDEESTATEFRVYVTGETEMRIVNYCRTHRLLGSDDDYVDFFNKTRFPALSAWRALGLPSTLVVSLRRIYENGGRIKIADHGTVATIDDVSFNVNTLDDVRFVDEIFYRNSYNIMTNRPSCVIDIGMNIGLVSLRLAKSESVKEVHAFEPFRRTYERAMANIDLNGDVADKISAYNYGLTEKDDELTVLVADETDSGLLSIRSARSGSPNRIKTRDAASTLAPIIRSAKARKLDIIAKVDCEGSEFPIFEQLSSHKLLPEITAFMVEWHRAGGNSQRKLIEPLLRYDFVIFDISRKEGNGFFYAVRTSRSSRRSTMP